MSQKKLTVAVVGLGSRGNSYAACCKLMSDKIEIVACSDIIPEKMERFAKEYGVPENMCFPSAEDLLKEEKLADVLFICTMDKQHYGHAIPALEKGYHLLLEKPASPDPKECVEIARVANENNRHVLVCHVLRYTPYFRKLKEILDSGMLGRIMSIQATEPVVFWHQAHSFVRGNWRRCDETSPMILQKCCHDMDILLWLTGKHCKSVSSFGSLSYFKEENAPEGAPERCSEACPAYAECPYSINRYLYHAERGNYAWPLDVVSAETDYDKFKADLMAGPYSRCAFKCDNDVVDHQVVNLLLDDDLTISFTMCAFTSENGGRSIHVMGTKGDLTARSDNDTITVTLFKNGIQETVNIESGAVNDSFGHGGGDYVIIEDLHTLLTEGVSDSASLSSINDSIESHIVALAAEKSRVGGGALVHIDDYVKSL